VAVLHCKPGRLPDRLFEAAAHPVSLDGIAMLFGDGEADARSLLRFFAVEDFEKEVFAAAGFALPDSKKLRPAFQPPDSFFISHIVRHSPRIPGMSALSRQTSAATGAAGCKNLLATLGSHAGAEAVTTLADKLGRLVGTLHLFNTAVCGPS
jgi:hypothetical protein